MNKIIEISGVPVQFRASASVPRLYRIKFGRDIMQDMASLEKSFKRASAAQKIATDATDEEKEQAEREAQLTVFDLTTFENVAYIMAKHAAPESVPGTPEEWLDNFPGVFDIYRVLPELTELWGESTKSIAVPKNGQGRQQGS